MKKLLNLLLLAAILLSGCAGVKLFKDEDFNKRTGLKFYYPKPYLLVERNAAKDVPLKTTILFLPDLANPVYAKVISGWGSNAFSIALANGSLSTYGITTDSKIPETITAAGGVLTGLGGFLTGKAALATASKDVQQAATVGDLQELKKEVEKVQADLTALTTFPSFVTTIQKDKLESAKTEIKNTISLLGQLNPLKTKEIAASIKKVVDELMQHLCIHDTPECKNYNGVYLKLVDQLNKVKEKIEPADTSGLPAFELYEILTDGAGGMTYKLIKPVVQN